MQVLQLFLILQGILIYHFISEHSEQQLHKYIDKEQ